MAERERGGENSERKTKIARERERGRVKTSTIHLLPAQIAGDLTKGGFFFRQCIE